MEFEKREIVVCNSKDSSNELVFEWIANQEEKEKEVICSVYMYYPKFFDRLKKGLKYIFGKNSNECFFETFYIQSKDAWKIQKIATFLKRKNNNGDNK